MADNDVLIAGEYWIIDGSVDFADGGISDKNHEYIAREYLVLQYQDLIEQLAEKYGVPYEDAFSYGEVDLIQVEDVILGIEEALKDRGVRNATEVLERKFGDSEVVSILKGGGDARQYAMDHYGWIAVRGNNVELSGYDYDRQQEIAGGIWDILEGEGFDTDNIDPSNVELSVYDHATGRSWYVTLQDLEQPQVSVRPSQALTTRTKGLSRDSEENKYHFPAKSKDRPWNVAARQYGLGSELWRGTSEGFEWAVNRLVERRWQF